MKLRVFIIYMVNHGIYYKIYGYLILFSEKDRYIMVIAKSNIRLKL